MKMASIIANNNLNVNHINNNLLNISNNNNNINDKNSNEKIRPKFGKVVISLENCILSNDKLSLTPSMADGLDYEYEFDLRILGCELIQTSGILLRLPQVAMATGQVLFQRYYFSKSLVRCPMEITAMACVTLASKIEEAPRRIRDVINVFHHMKQMRLKNEDKPLFLDENYIMTKNNVIKAERRLLKELGFCVHVKHPHKFIVTLLQVLENEKNHQLMQTSWNYMNDSLRTNAFVRYSPETIACACIYLSARVLGVPLPNNPNWFEVFRITEDQIRDVCVLILSLYTRPKPNQEELEKIVEQLRKNHENAKLKAKELNIIENGTPTQRSEVSPNSRPVTPQPKLKSENVSPKNKLKSITSVVSHTSSPKKRKESPQNERRSRSKSRSLSPINREKGYSNYDYRDRNYQRGERDQRTDRDRSPPKSYAYEYSPSEKSGRHKHKRITYSRSRSRSPAIHSHRHKNHHNSKHHSYDSLNRKSRKRSKSPYNRGDRNSYHSRYRRSRSRDLYDYRKS